MSIINTVKTELHKIRIRLHPSNLPGAEGTWFARVNNEAILSIEEIAASLKDRGGFTGSYNDLVNHVRQFLDEMAYQLCNGYAVNTGYFSIHPNVGGVFKSQHEEPNPKEHPVSFSFHARLPLRKLARQIEVKLETGVKPPGSIVHFTDIETGAEKKAVSGNLFRICGYKIKIKGNSPDCGIYFVSAKDPTRIIKTQGPFPLNTSSKICGLIPDLPAGKYFIEIKTQYTIGGIDLKEPRTIRSSFTITVA
ncbi:MAG: DUF4469 domain-containing protein [Treponema sp.]|jgi:hypothetical protein|nr:DUF4469 domain-containing protein [Treponema sp.]